MISNAAFFIRLLYTFSALTHHDMDTGTLGFHTCMLNKWLCMGSIKD